MIKTGRSRVTQACEHCRSLKLKCSSGDPCNRCRDANIECLYSVNRPKPKPVITKPKFHRLKAKQKVLEETFQEVQTLLKRYNNTDISIPPDLPSKDSYELCFNSSDKFQYQFFRTPSSSPNLQEFPRILTGDFVNSKELSLVAPAMKLGNIKLIIHIILFSFSINFIILLAQHEFYQKLVDDYLSYNFHNFPMLLRKDLYQLLNQRDYDNSIVLQGVFAVSLNLFYYKNIKNQNFNNHFYIKLKRMINSWQNTSELDYIKGCILAVASEIGMDLNLQSTALNGVSIR
jgi:hypothetical protein